ncbi:3-deoxy-manno-octulosonate cytidylyltransferase [Pelagibacteraceae bacterium]|jgi:3-deoxy-manno-octulosonate cytidylyltransferase (CMP-KDO synthetase)|nr:3-deoxy-manno-octulosonate cytidylyltransferase [Pelagibacteraceae bacterium]MDC1158215.1 3-deoxy-manno-octulosonate cytidylyltransferase [Pelagibacteraceae bacterium]
MNKIAIIIPSRLDALRLPNKPLELINNKEMILHVYEAAKKTNTGEVYVATPDQKIIDVITNHGGQAILTSLDHQTGTDRVYEVFRNELRNEPSLIINLQGDMPNIDPKAISDLAFYMKKGKCDIGTLASKFVSEEELTDENNVKVAVKEKIESGNFGKAVDFFRTSSNTHENIYHHVGIYAFTNKALVRYVSLERSKLELERKLEQLRALENDISIHVGYIKSSPLSVDTKNDLIEVKKIMENNE